MQIIELKDNAVCYRIAGFLQEVKLYVTRHSELLGAVLDTFHSAGVEIVSPSFAIHRTGTQADVVIPRSTVAEKPEQPSGETAEAIAFDKAEKAETIEKLKETADLITKEINDLKSGSKDIGNRKDTRERIETLTANLHGIEVEIARRSKHVSG